MPQRLIPDMLTVAAAAMSIQYILVNAEAAALLVAARITLLHPLCPPLHRLVTGQSDREVDSFAERIGKGPQSAYCKQSRTKASSVQKREDELELTRQESDTYALTLIQTELAAREGG